MKKYNKHLFVVMVVLMIALLFTFSGCNKESINIEDLEIEAIDAVDVPVGTYTVPYTIDNINEYIAELGVSVVVSAVDQDNNQIDTTGNTFTVEAGKVYTVTIKAIQNEEVLRSKVVTVTAVEDILNFIEVTTMPSKTTYDVGDLFLPAGMIVKGNYPSGQKIITDYTYKTTTLDMSDAVFYISYGGKTTTIDLTISAISLDTPANVSFYYDYYLTFDAVTNAISYEIWLNGTIYNITETAFDVAQYIQTGNTYTLKVKAKASGYNDSAYSDELTFSTVIDSLVLLQPPTKTIYIEGETFDPAGMIVSAVFADQKSTLLSADTYTYRTDILTPFDTAITLTHTASGKFLLINLTILLRDETWTVTFNGNGGIRTGGGAEVQGNISHYGSATAPVYTKKGFLFNGFDIIFDNVTSDLTVTAQWLDITVGSAGLTYVENYNNTACYIESYWGSDETIIIPQFNDEKPVIGIESQAFLNNTNIKRVFIGKNITYIMPNAFKGCSNFSEIIVDSQSNYFIEDGALYKDNTLVLCPPGKGGSVNIPEGITGIARQALDNCIGITHIYVPDSVTIIGEYAFRNTGWYDLQNEGAVYAGKVLYNYKGTMPANTHITLIDGTKAIASGAFSNKHNLIEISFSEELEYIGSNAFYDCKGLTNLAFPDSLIEVGVQAFDGSTNIENISFGTELERIGDSAFRNCSALQTVYLADSAKLTVINKGVFQNCVNLVSVDFGDNNNIIIIEENAFKNCYKLENFVFSESIYTIENNAFENCRDFTELTLPASLKVIGEYAFASCLNLSVVYSQAATPPSIGVDAFYNTSSELKIWVERIRFASYISSWNAYESKIYPITVLIEFESNSGSQVDSSEIAYGAMVSIPEAPTKQDYIFDGWCDESLSELYDFDLPVTQDIILYARWKAPTEGLAYTLINNGTAYSVAKGNAGDNELIIIPSTHNNLPVISIDYQGFLNCQNLKNIIIPDTITEIEAMAFNGCTLLEGINLSEGITTIGDTAFQGCTSLVEISFPDTLVNIGTQAFFNTAWFDSQPDGMIYAGKVAYRFKGAMAPNTEITILHGTKSIAASAFEGCYNMSIINIPEGVVTIGNYAFYNCTGLTDVNIPGSVVYIGNFAFQNCTNLETVTISENIAEIGEKAFLDCVNLQSVTINATTPPILGSNVFERFGILSYYLLDITIYVPMASVDEYKNAINWSNYASKIEAMSED